jgi:hypothetical protein
MTSGRHNNYSAAELDWLKDRARMPRAQLHDAFCKTFNRDDVSRIALDGLMKRKRWMTGRIGFEAGHIPHSQNFIGHERLNKDGYVEISVAEPNPFSRSEGSDRRYVLKHKRLWEDANGPVPEGHCLKCIDGSKTNTDPTNWQAVPRAILPRLNGGRGKRLSYARAEPDVRPSVLAVAKLKHAALEARKDNLE